MRSSEFITRKIILEGGNVIITTRNGDRFAADKIDLTKIDRSKFAKDMLLAFTALDKKFTEVYKKPLWPNKAVFKHGHVFNGSSEALFDNRVPSKQYIKAKPSVGDIDITVPEDTKEELWNLFKKIEGTMLTDNIKYLGNSQPVFMEGKEQLHVIFQYIHALKQSVNVQVDFEFVPYKNGKPSEFSKFGHSSDWTDLEGGLKGVHHKYILRALTSGSSLREDFIVMTPASTPAKPRLKKMNGTPSMLTFYMGKGVRLKYKQQYMPDGSPWMYNGKKVYKEVSSVDSNYVNDLTKIFTMIFKKPKNKEEVSKIWSFTGVLGLMKQYHTPDQIKSTLMRLLESYWGPDAQGLERNNPKEDSKIKSKGWDKITQMFPVANTFDVKSMKKSYYKNYTMSAQNTVK